MIHSTYKLLYGNFVRWLQDFSYLLVPLDDEPTELLLLELVLRTEEPELLRDDEPDERTLEELELDDERFILVLVLLFLR